MDFNPTTTDSTNTTNCCTADTLGTSNSGDSTLNCDNNMIDAEDKSPNSHSLSTTTSPMSAPVYSDDLCGRVGLASTLNLLPRQSSVSSTKTCEVDLGDEERDSYSPLSSSHSNSPDDDVAITANRICKSNPILPTSSSSQLTAAAIDNKIFNGCILTQSHGSISNKINNVPTASSSTPSKEEKQRQNEEIVIMETSSISSETGSWESVFPHGAAATATAAAAAIAAVTPLLPECAAEGSSKTKACNEPLSTTLNIRNYCSEFLKHERQKLEKPKEKGKAERGHWSREFEGHSEDEGHLRDPALKTVKATETLRIRAYSTGASTGTTGVTADTSSLFIGGSSSSIALLRTDNLLSTSGTSACFIDASSLRDEDEKVPSFTDVDSHRHSIDSLDSVEKEEEKDKPNSSRTDDDNNDKFSPTNQLETFHKAFAKCRTKAKDTLQSPPKVTSSSSSSASSHSPHKELSTASLTNNLSDEEKLWKREISAASNQMLQPGGYSEAKDLRIEKDTHESQEANLQLFSTGNEDATEQSLSLVGDLDSSDSSEIVKLRREQERRQGSYIFQQHLQQHPKLPFHSTVTHHNDLSYTTDYSSSSPAPSLIWSEHELRLNGSGVNRLQIHHPLQTDDYDATLHKSGHIIPETPHNSIAHINDGNLSTSSSIHRDYTMSSSCSQQRDSGAYCSDATDSPIPMPRTPKRTKCDEANPIISGGATFADFGSRKVDSPKAKRRHDMGPIVSDGFRSLDFERTCPQSDEDIQEVELRKKPAIAKPISVMTSSWIVDMSDCQSDRRKTATNSLALKVDCGDERKLRQRTDSGSSNKSNCGFYVSLEHINQNLEDIENANRKSIPQMSKSFGGSRSSDNFTNSGGLDNGSARNGRGVCDKEVVSGADSGGEKRNIFSMFIDFGEKKMSSGVKREPFNLAARLSNSFTSSSSSSVSSSAQQRTRCKVDDQIRSEASSTETLMSKSTTLKAHPDNEIAGIETKSLDYKCNKPIITVADLKRISKQHRSQNEVANKRHSWGNGPTQEANAKTSTDYKRSISLTVKGDNCNAKEASAGGGGLMSIIDKLPLISKTSSLSVDSSLSPFDDYTGSKSELSSGSNVNSGGEEINKNGNGPNVAKVKKRRKDVEINETFDKSSIGSITDGILSKDLSPASTTDTDDLTFQQDEELAKREAILNVLPPVLPISQSNRPSAAVMETILEAKETSSPKKNLLGHTMETLHATIEKQKQLLETVNEHGGGVDLHEKSSSGNFVKLSDMDKPVKYDSIPYTENMMSKSAGGNNRQIGRLYRDDAIKTTHVPTGQTGSAGRPHSWTMMTRSSGNSSFLNITTSVDNLRSLSRIFPNFSKEFSNSLPNDMILDQQIDDYIQTDISADSSLASSFSRSGMDESSISCRQPRRLGEDLLKMFLQEIATDMLVEVSGRRIRAHKCILRSRCQYFAAMLAGNNTSQSVVTLPGYSYSAVHFALCHIYSGASHPPDGISLMELAALADLLGLEGLKEVTAHALKTNYCHNFHKPCSGCIDGILQVLPVALNHALDDLYRKCLRWTCRHYLKVWPTRQFAQLPLDILGRCRQQIMAYMTSETVLDTVLDCDNLISQLSPFRWGDVCKTIVRDIMDAAYAYIGDHFASLIASDAFLSLGHDKSCHIPRLQEMLLRTASNLTADQACRSYQRVTRLNTVLQAKVIQMPTNLGELAKELQGLQDEELEWDPEFVRMVSAILSAVEQCLTRQCSRAMRVTAWQRMDLELRKKIQTLARLNEPIDSKRVGSKPVAKAFSFGGSTRSQDLYQVKLAIQAHSKRAMAQDTQLYKATQTQDGIFNVQTAERGVQANNDIKEGTSKILKSNSRAYVPQIQRNNQSTTSYCSEHKTTITHRRTQSEAPTSLHSRTIALAQQQQTQKQIDPKIPSKPRLTEIRPRYLEPRKSRGTTFASNGPVRSATSGNITASRAKGHHISSSDSSRNSSPATRDKPLKIASISKSTRSSVNMSMDNLESPTRRTKHIRSSTDNERFSDLDSMKSSTISNANKTVSQESIKSTSKQLALSNPQIPLSKTNSSTKISNNTNNNNNNNGSRIYKPFHVTQQTAVVVSKINNKLNGNIVKPHTKSPQKAQQKQLQIHPQNKRITSASSSASSVVTTKPTSRLSSVSSTTSARELYKNRSISVPASQDKNSPGDHPQRRSFLSAKSREILAKRAEKNKQQQQQQQQHQKQSEQQDHRINLVNEKVHPVSAPPRRSSSLAAVPTALANASSNNRSSLTSNIPTRRPNTLYFKATHSANTTLALTGNANNNTANTNNPNKTITSNNRNRMVSTVHGYKSAAIVAQAVQQKIELLIDNAMRPSIIDKKDISTTAMGTKLERSSTFCKESSELDLNELQIVE